MENIKWRTAAAVENGYLRDSYPEWVDDYLKCEDMLAQKQKLTRKREEIKAAPRALADVKKAFLSSLKNFVEFSQVQSLKAFINNYARHPDPANELRGEHLDSPLRVFSLWPDDILQKAFDELAETWPEDTLTDSERKKQIDAIDRQIAKIDRDLNKYPDYSGWREFVDSWRMLNSKVSEGCDPQGFPITAEKKPGEQAAFTQLKMHKYINPKSNFVPAAP
jgi:hypothetical protein